MKKIPLNSLVFLIDVSPQEAEARFPANEIMSSDAFTTELLGPMVRPDLRGVVQAELERTVFLKLSLGQRVVVSMPDLRRDARINMAREAQNRGFTVIYLVDDLNIRRDMARGDRVADVVDTNSSFEVVMPLPDENFFAELKKRGFKGVTVVPDIHGTMNPLRDAISWARSRNNFLLFLGDLIDYGIDTLEVVDEVYQLVVRGEAEALEGNHEKKIFKHLAQVERTGVSHVRLSEGNKVTVSRMQALGKFDHDRWVTRFKALVHMMRNHRVSDGFIFAHGAVKPEMWTITDNRLPTSLEEVSLYGEVDTSVNRSDGYPNRVYNWVDELTPNQIAVVGHDIRSDFEPLKHQGAKGGTAIFMDTGCGKGGHLSTLDIRFDGDVVKVENFNLH